MPFSGHGKDAQPNILQLNTKRLTANKIFVIEQLADKNKTFIIVLQETHCRQARDSQLFTSCVSPEQEPWAGHICP